MQPLSILVSSVDSAIPDPKLRCDIETGFDWEGVTSEETGPREGRVSPAEREVNDKSRDGILVLKQIFCSLSFLLPACLTGIDVLGCVYFFHFKGRETSWFSFLLLKSWSPAPGK